MMSGFPITRRNDFGRTRTLRLRKHQAQVEAREFHEAGWPDCGLDNLL
jgi:hypothetical protein